MMPRWFYVARVAVRSLFARHVFDDQLNADLQFHLEEATAEYIREGLSREDARRAALKAFGNPTQVMEEVRDMSVWTWWERLAQDVRYGLRGFRRSPVFAATAVLSLALGIGANTAIFGVIDAALLRDLPVTNPERLALISNPKLGDFSYPDYLALRDGTRVFSDVVAASRALPVNVGAGIDTDRASAKIVSGSYFAGLGVRSAIGRVFTIADETEAVAVISHGYWRRRFGGSSTVLGQQVRLDGIPFAIVGVAPARFFGETPGESPDLWTTVALQPPARRSGRGFTWLNLIGRLRPGASLQQAEADVDAVLTAVRPTSSPDDDLLRDAAVSPGARGGARLRSRFAAPLGVLMVIVGLVLLIACTNLGGLLVARGAARQGEIAMRLAIGASRARIVRQLITESLLLALAGGALGQVFAVWLSGALLRMVSGALMASLPVAGLGLDVGIDGRMLLFTGVVSLAAGALFGLAPALRAVGRQAGSILMDGGRHLGGRERRWSVRDAFIIAQIALSLILLAGSAMFIRTLRNLERQDLGFPLDDRLQVSIVLERGYRPALETLVPSLLAQTRAIPGVAAASVAFSGTLAGSGGGVYGLQFDGYPPRDPQDHRARADWVGPDYFRTVGIPLVAGRDFTLADTATAQRVAVVNQTMARHFFRDSAAVGRRFTFNKHEHEIVGVVKDAKYTSLREATPRMVYFPTIQTGTGFNVLEIRTSLQDPVTVVAAVRSAIREVDPRLSAVAVMTLSERLDRNLIREHVVTDLAGFFSGLTLVLVSIGVYGTLAYGAAQRTREIGVRLALGSRRGAVIWILMREVVVRLGLGLVLGTIGVVMVGRLVGSMLFGLGPNDVPTIAMAVLLLSFVALFAGYIPTFRASRLDPASILRE
jgi:predicted permease